MADCATVQPLVIDGQTVEALVRAPGPCTSYVLVTPAEYASMASSPLSLSVEDGTALSAAILAVWGIAWAARAIVRALDVDGDPQSD